MFTWGAHLLLNVTSVAPVMFVYAASIALDHPRLATIVGVIVVLLTALCALLLYGARKYGEREQREIESISGLEKEPVSFLVAYALPVIGAAFKANDGQPPWAGLLALSAFVVTMTALVWQQQVSYVNPLAAVLGFHFHSACSSEGESVLVVSRRKTIKKGVVTIVALSDYLWLDAG